MPGEGVEVDGTVAFWIFGVVVTRDMMNGLRTCKDNNNPYRKGTRLKLFIAACSFFTVYQQSSEDPIDFQSFPK